MDADTSIGYFDGPTSTVIDAIIAGGFDGAMLELQGNTPEEFKELVEAVNAAHPELADGNRRATEAFRIGPIPVGVGPHRIPIEGDNLARLREVADDAFFVTLDVLDDEGVLVSAADVSDGEIWINERVPPDAVKRMRAVLGDDLRPPPSIPPD